MKLGVRIVLEYSRIRLTPHFFQENTVDESHPSRLQELGPVAQ